MNLRGHILIACNDPATLAIVQEMARENSFHVDVVDSLAAEFDNQTLHPYDTLILDLDSLGDQQNLKFSAPILEKHRLPLILITGNPTAESAIQAFSLPVIAYLIKPLVHEELRDWVERAIEYSRISQSGRNAFANLEGWTQQVGQLQHYLSSGPRATLQLPLSNFVSLTMANMLGSMLDIKHLVEAATGHQAQNPVCHLYDCPRLQTHRNLLRETVDVLQRTKSYVKSHDLGELRQRLQAFLDETEQNDS
jgi:DNA-binding response OmpR family regulator